MKKLKETNDTVLVFMDGSLQRQLSSIDPNKKNIEISSLKEDVPDWALEIISDKHSENSDQIFDINTILMQDGALINTHIHRHTESAL